MKKRAYTLFELLVSISIIGILIAVASVSYGAAQKKARDTRRIEDMNAIQKAAEMYYSQKNYIYPADTNDFIAGEVLQKWPADPKAGWSYTYVSTADTYCACAEVDNISSGNSDATCTFNSTGVYYCVESQQ